MLLHGALSYAGLLAAAVLLFAAPSRSLALVAVLAAGLEVLLQLGFIRLHVVHVPLGLVLGLALAVPALVIWFRASSKAAVTAGAVAAFVGLLQLAAYAVPRM
jgi:hypothetical protein